MSEYNAERLSTIKTKLKELLISELSLEDIEVSEIADDETLFGEGLGLDSLDAVEIVVLLQRHFNLEIQDMEKGKEIFFSMDTLAKYVYDNTDE